MKSGKDKEEQTAMDDRNASASTSSPEFEVRYAPKVLRERRRNDLRIGLFSIAIAVFCFVMAFMAHRRHVWVDAGGMHEDLALPPWLVALLGLGLLYFGAWTLWTNLKPSERD